MKFLFIVSIVFILSFHSSAQYRGGGGPNAFYYVPFSPREVAMGGTGVASAKGVFAAYWNPALLFDSASEHQAQQARVGIIGRLGGNEGETGRNFYAPTRVNGGFVYEWKQDSTSFLPVKGIGVGMDFHHRGVQGIKGTSLSTITDEITEGETFNFSESMVRMSCAFRDIGNMGLSTGINWRWAIINLPNVSTLEVRNIDVGIYGRKGEFSSGVSMNIDHNRGVDKHVNFRFNWGLSWNRRTGTNTELVIATEINFGEFTPRAVGLGGELVIQIDVLEISPRLGLKWSEHSNAEEDSFLFKEFAWGFGLRWKGITLDMSYQEYLHDEDNYVSYIDPQWKIGIEYVVPLGWAGL